jgi:hypothetical protein
VTQTNIVSSNHGPLRESIPTGRNPWVMAGLVPGVVTGRLDVGGTEGMQQYNLEAFGSADSQKSFSIDGLKTNWGGGGGGATMQYYGFEMYEEYNMQTASGTAESDVSGVFMNMVTKSGGNRFTSDHNFYFMNDALQGENVDDDLRARWACSPGESQTGAAGNPIDISYDWSSTLGGPIVRDRAWFFGAFRLVAAGPAADRRAQPRRLAGHRRQPHQELHGQGHVADHAEHAHVGHVQPQPEDRFHRRDSPYLFVEDKATVLQDQPAQNFVAQYNHVLGKSMVVDARVGSMWGTFPSRYQSEVGRRHRAARRADRFQRFNAAEIQSLNPNYRIQANGTLSYFVPQLAGGSHDFKVGMQLSWEKMEYERIRNGDILLEMRDGTPFQGRSPTRPSTRITAWRPGVRSSRIAGRSAAPPSTSACGWTARRGTCRRRRARRARTSVSDRSPRSTSTTTRSTSCPASASRTTCSATADGPEGLLRTLLQPVRLGASRRPRTGTPWPRSTWRGRTVNGNRQLDPGELGNIPTFGAGLFPTVDANSKRPYSDEINAGVEHQLIPNLAVGVSYHRRQHRNGLGVVDRARPSTAYTPENRTYTDSDGSVKSITIYKLQPAFGSLRDRVITNVDVLESDYDGVQFDVQKRMSNRWQMLAGLSLQKHKGFDHGGTFTNPGNATDFNNPNYILNRDDGSVFTELPWTFTLSGTYVLPLWDITTSAKYTARDGDPLNRTQLFSFTSPTTSQPSETIRVVQRGEDRTETVNKFVDIRFAKRFQAGRANLEATVDLFNLLNANHVLGQTEALGATWSRPNRILTPRIIRFGVTARF